MKDGAHKPEIQNNKVVRRLLGKNLRFVLKEFYLQRLESKQEESTEGEEIKQQQRMKIMKDLTKTIRSKGRVGY